MKLIKIFLISLMLFAISMMFLGCNSQPRDTGQEREQEQAQPQKIINCTVRGLSLNSWYKNILT